MKICYIAVLDRVIKYFFGPQIDAMREDNNEVTCITNFYDLEFRESLDKRIKTQNIEISRNVNPLNLIKCILKLTRIFRREKYDVIQFTGPSTGLICAIAGSLAGVKTRIYCLWGVRYVGFSGVKRKIFKFLEKISCSLATKVIFDSEYNRQFLIDERVIAEKKACVVSKGSACGIDLCVFDVNKKEEYKQQIREKYNIPATALVFGYLGRISYEKGINELLFAARQILSQDNNVYFLVVGFTEQREGIDSELWAWAESEKRVVFTGRQDEPEKFYAAFDLFIFPSYREGFGGGVVQAGAFGVPSIVSDIGPLAESIKYGELGWSFSVKDQARLTEVAGSVYKDRAALGEKGSEMLAYVRKYFDREHWMEEYKQQIYSASKEK